DPRPGRRGPPRRACGRDVRRARRRGRAGAADLRRAAAPLHRPAARVAAQPRRRRPTAARADPRAAPAADRPPPGLPGPPALPAGPRRVRAAAAAAGTGRGPGGVLGPGRGVDLMLEAVDLVKRYPVRGTDAVVHALNGVSFTLAPGETLGIVGE